MSARHRLDSEGAVVCGASPHDDGSNVTSNPAGVSCTDCRAAVRHEQRRTVKTVRRTEPGGPWTVVEVQPRWEARP